MIIDKNDNGRKTLFPLMVLNIIGMMNPNCIALTPAIVDLDVKVLNRTMKRPTDSSAAEKAI